MALVFYPISNEKSKRILYFSLVSENDGIYPSLNVSEKCMNGGSRAAIHE